MRRFFRLYIDGFRNMPVYGRRLWIILLIKLFIMFFVLKFFFFPDILKSNFNNDAERADHVLENLTK
jgi:ABC-type amino acid transport system permease subunit